MSTATAPRTKAEAKELKAAKQSEPTAVDDRSGSPLATDTRPLSNELIGETAGLVWSYLASNGPQTLAKLKKGVSAPGDTVLHAIGWLAREHKLTYETKARTTTIGLCEGEE